MLGEFFYGWLIVALLFLILEISSPGLFFFFSFFIGALCSAGIALLAGSVAVQLLVFLFFSVCSCFLLPLWFKQKVQERGYATNAQALLGKRAIVIKAIGRDFPGQVKVQGEIWSARSINNHDIQEGAAVEVVQVRGVHLFVKNS